MFRFASPLFLLLLFVVAFAIFLKLRNKSKNTIKVSSLKGVDNLSSSALFPMQSERRSKMRSLALLKEGRLQEALVEAKRQLSFAADKSETANAYFLIG